MRCRMTLAIAPSLDDDDVPLFLGCGPDANAVATTRKAPSAPAFLSDDWDDESPPARPTLLRVRGGLPLLYPGESHMLYGEGGKGKSWFALHAAADVARSGGQVLYLDRESNMRTLRSRLRAMGLSREEAGRVAYWRLSGSLLPGTPNRRVLDAWLDEHRPVLIVLDSVSKDLASAGFSENDPDEHIRWQELVVEPWTERSVTSLLIDHTGHQGAAGRGGRVAARGASSKKDQVSGASYFFEVVKHWTRTSSGSARVTCTKDREGHREAWTVAAYMNVAVADDGALVTITFEAPDEGAAGVPAQPRRTWYMEQVSQLLAEHADGLSGSKVEAHFETLGKSKGYAQTALRDLVTEGFVNASEPGLRGTVTHTLVRPFVADEEPSTRDLSSYGNPGMKDLF